MKRSIDLIMFFKLFLVVLVASAVSTPVPLQAVEEPVTAKGFRVVVSFLFPMHQTNFSEPRRGYQDGSPRITRAMYVPCLL